MIIKFSFLLFFASLSIGMGNASSLHETKMNTYNESSLSNDSIYKNELLLLKAWRAGAIISKTTIEKVGTAACFQQESITPTLFKRINTKSYKSNCTIPLKDLRYLKVLHYDQDGRIHLGELICNKEISNDLLAIFRQLYESHYPIERMTLIDNYNANDELSMQHNNTSCFNFRKIKGTKIISKHSAGRAVDINPLYNPCVKKRNGRLQCQPQTAKKYMDRTKTYP